MSSDTSRTDACYINHDPTSTIKLSDVIALARQLERELAAARADNAKLLEAADRYGDGADWVQRALQAEAVADVIEEELEQALADAERYRFLKSHISVPGAVHEFLRFNDWHPDTDLRDLDAAIDAAMKEQGK